MADLQPDANVILRAIYAACLELRGRTRLRPRKRPPRLRFAPRVANSARIAFQGLAYRRGPTPQSLWLGQRRKSPLLPMWPLASTQSKTTVRNRLPRAQHVGASFGSTLCGVLAEAVKKEEKGPCHRCPPKKEKAALVLAGSQWLWDRHSHSCRNIESRYWAVTATASTCEAYRGDNRETIKSEAGGQCTPVPDTLNAAAPVKSCRDAPCHSIVASASSPSDRCQFQRAGRLFCHGLVWRWGTAFNAAPLGHALARSTPCYAPMPRVPPTGSSPGSCAITRAVEEQGAQTVNHIFAHDAPHDKMVSACQSSIRAVGLLTAMGP